ncbi:PHD finger protein 10-like [Convolutriloba macropyga]|uniref:PHD finger protein 10-like n=1 Tax=Convolutriloba macropyga TaxID=536237 RepID=UPI003F524CC6
MIKMLTDEKSDVDIVSTDSALWSSTASSATSSPVKSVTSPASSSIKLNLTPAPVTNVSGLPGPETVIEYRWPLADGEDYVLQEPLAQYLGITSFRRKFPDLFRRNADIEERHYLLHMKIINANEEIFGVTALKADDAHHIMQTHFPEAHNKYVAFWKQKRADEKAALLAKNDVTAIKSDREKMQKLMKEALLDTAKWNSQLNEERRAKRSAYFDLQTFNIHYPRDYPKYDRKLSELICAEKANALPPFRSYTPHQLKYLPLKSVACGPLGVIERSDTSDPVFPDSSDSETEAATDVDFNTSNATNSGPSTSQSSGRSSKGSSKSRRSTSSKRASADANGVEDGACSSPKRKSSGGASNSHLAKDVSSMTHLGLEGVPSLSSLCGICFKGSLENKFGNEESLISCSQCTNAGHPTCLELSDSIVSVIMTYNWQCMECKVCMTCKSATDEENLMFCDNCDRGYHSYCVGMNEIPTGRWVCEICGDCVSCLRFGGNYTGEWKEEYTRPRDKSEPSKFLQRHCEDCSKSFNKGEFCPICLKVFDSKAVADDSLASCMSCERLVHLECDPKFAAQFRVEKAMSSPRSSANNRRRNPYNCSICRGEIEERMDSFHVRNRHDK